MIPTPPLPEEHYFVEAHFYTKNDSLYDSRVMKEMYSRHCLRIECEQLEKAIIKLMKVKRLDKYRGYWK